MRRNIVAGVALAAAAGVVVAVSHLLDLELVPVALLGVAIGGVLALVPDRSAGARVGGFAAGLLAAWVGYVVRAAVLPDSDTGVAITLVLTLLVCVGVVAVTRLPLWALLLGAATMAGAYEQTYTAAPPQVLSTSTAAVTTLILTVAAGLLACALVGDGQPRTTPRREHAADQTRTADLAGADQ